MSSEMMDSLTRELQEKTRTIEKLRKYIANVEADGDRLNRELTIANSFRLCFDSVANPLFMVSTTFEIDFVNKAFVDFVGSTAEELARGHSAARF